MTEDDMKGGAAVRTVRPPRHFVGLHGHSGFSVYDGMSLPQQHIDFVLNNEMDAWALTDHGNANGHAHAFAKAEALQRQGREFRYIPGCEFYIHPDLEQWREAWKAQKERRAKQTKRPVADDEAGGGVVEDEEETKQTKWFDPVKRRHHLVVLARNHIGLENLYTLITRSYDEGFYRFPRIDYRMLREHGEGLIVSTACIGGPCAYEVMRHHQDVAWDDMLPNIGTADDFEAIQRSLEDVVGNCIAAVGDDNFFLELQFNRLGVQHLVNQHLIALSRRMDVPLIATADSHYPGPDLWKDRELYKKLGWLNYEKYEPGMLPTSTDELKAELYPKNAQQMWDAYRDSVEHFSERVDDWSFYDDEEVRDAVERTHDIAHDMCEDVFPSKKHLFAPRAILGSDEPDEDEAMRLLVERVKEGLAAKGLADREEYIARARDELEVIKEKRFAMYFLTMARVMNIATENMLTGPGRGSGAGSLVNYVLGITQIDPIKHGLLFARFLSRNRVEAPDIDSDVSDNDRLKQLLREEFGEENVVPVSNFNQLAAKSLVKDISRFYGIQFDEVNAATKGVEYEVKAKVLKPGDDKNVFVLKYDDMLAHSPKFRAFIEKYPQVGEHVENLFEQNKSIGRHAGGVVIGEKIHKRMPVIRVRGEKQTSWTEGLHYRMLESTAGLLKYDLLGLKTLRIIERAIRLILKRHRGGIVSVQLGDDTIRLLGDQLVRTKNRGDIRASDITDEDDIYEVPGVWREEEVP